MPPHHAHVAQPVHHAPPAVLAAALAAGEAPAPTLLPLRGYRKAMVRSMELAGRVPHFHFCDEVEVRAAR